MFDFLQICLRKAKPVCKIPHMFILADVWLLPNMFGKNQTRWYIYTWVPFSTHVWILTHMFGKTHTCVTKTTQLYDCKCLAFSAHVWEKPPTCFFPPELSVWNYFTQATNSRSDPFRRSLTFCLKLQISPSQLKSDLSHFCDQQLKLFLHFPLPLQNFPSNGDLLLESSSRLAQHAKHSWVNSAYVCPVFKRKSGIPRISSVYGSLITHFPPFW